MRSDNHPHLVLQIRALLDKHLGTNIRENGLWRIQALVDDEIEGQDWEWIESYENLLSRRR